MKLTRDLYERVRARLMELGHGDDYTWAQNVKAPESPEALACEYTWVVINSGMKNTVAHGIMDRVWPWLVGGCVGPVPFGHVGKMKAIADVWCTRESKFLQFLERDAMSTQDVLDWCESLPWIGRITKYHLAKNLGADVAKPDRWLVRLAEAEQETVDGLCQRLACETRDRVATVDVILWRACAVGVLSIRDGAIVADLSEVA